MTNYNSDGQKRGLEKLLILRKMLIGIAAVLLIAIGALCMVCYFGKPLTEELPANHPKQQSHSATESHGEETLPVEDNSTLDGTQPETQPDAGDDPTSATFSEENSNGIKAKDDDSDDNKKEYKEDDKAELSYSKSTGSKIMEKQVVDATSDLPEISKDELGATQMAEAMQESQASQVPQMFQAPQNALMTGKTYPRYTIIRILCILLSIDVVAILITSVCIASKRKALSQLYTESDDGEDLTGSMNQNETLIRIAKVHNIGARPYQEDALGFVHLEDGILAVAADGMGGLSGGDRVSKKIVQTMLEYGQKLQPAQMDGVLEAMVQGVNNEVNRMLGPSGIYKSGSTLLTVLVRRNRFHWATVGDSRIYLFRNGQLTKLNQEHNLGNEMLLRAIRSEISYEEARATLQKGRVTSFIGMGNLKYIDRSIYSIPIKKGDRIMLMTDGVFNTLPETVMANVLSQMTDVRDVALEFERLIKQKAAPKQDNFSALILGF